MRALLNRSMARLGLERAQACRTSGGRSNLTDKAARRGAHSARLAFAIAAGHVELAVERHQVYEQRRACER